MFGEPAPCGPVSRGWVDVVVVGGGPAGSTTASLLAEAGLDVLLFDRARFPRPKPCAEYLSPGAVGILERLGVTARLNGTSGCWLRGMELVAPAGARHLVAYASDGHAHHGLGVERTRLDGALLEVARSRGAEVREQHRVVGTLIEQDGVVGVRALDPRGQAVEARARLVVGADGRHSVLARDLRLRVRLPWPRRLGLVCHVAGVAWPEAYGQMWVGKRGYVGVAPVGPDLLSVGLVRPLPRGSLGSPGAALDEALAEYAPLQARLASGRRAGPVQGVGPLVHTVRRAAGPGFALVGDAAGFVDPFTGEGIYRALRGAELLAQAVQDALAAPGSGPLDVSASYARARRAHLAAKSALTWLIQVFVHAPSLMERAVTRLRASPALAADLGLVLGDLAPASRVLRADYLWRLLRP